VRQVDREALARCHGYLVAAHDALVGEVETPLFPPAAAYPDFLILRVAGPRGPRRPVIAAALVEDVDPAARILYVRGTRDEIEALPEHLPLVV
jgi:hypothetical protein